jgi:hypothetical protein
LLNKTVLDVQTQQQVNQEKSMFLTNQESFRYLLRKSLAVATVRISIYIEFRVLLDFVLFALLLVLLLSVLQTKRI